MHIKSKGDEMFKKVFMSIEFSVMRLQPPGILSPRFIRDKGTHQWIGWQMWETPTCEQCLSIPTNQKMLIKWTPALYLRIMKGIYSFRRWLISRLHQQEPYLQDILHKIVNTRRNFLKITDSGAYVSMMAFVTWPPHSDIMQCAVQDEALLCIREGDGVREAPGSQDKGQIVVSISKPALVAK